MSQAAVLADLTTYRAYRRQAGTYANGKAEVKVSSNPAFGLGLFAGPLGFVQSDVISGYGVYYKNTELLEIPEGVQPRFYMPTPDRRGYFDTHTIFDDMFTADGIDFLQQARLWPSQRTRIPRRSEHKDYDRPLEVLGLGFMAIVSDDPDACNAQINYVDGRRIIEATREIVNGPVPFLVAMRDIMPYEEVVYNPIYDPSVDE